MSSNRFFYHCFPRRKDADEIQKGISTLSSILDRGLLLTPEKIDFSERLADGSPGQPNSILQKRACFTELSPSELAEHAKSFGEFALEFEIAVLREMGAIPVFYVPLVSSTDRLGGLAATILCRLGEVQEILIRLENLKNLAAAPLDDNELLNMTRNGVLASTSRCTVGGAKDLIRMLETDVQPIGSLLATVRALFGFFYPVENLKYTGELAYYRQREWRLVGNVADPNITITRSLDQNDVDALILLDPDFFGRQIRFPTGDKAIAGECQFYRLFRGHPFHTIIRRIVAPKRAVAAVRDLLDGRNINTNVVSLESVSS